MRHAWTSASLLSRIAVYVLLICTIPAASAQNAAPVAGAEVYQKRCAMCHDQTGSQAPSRDVLQKMSAARILRTLDFGLMMGVAYPMKRDEREAVAGFLGTKGGDAPLPASIFCSASIHPMAGPATESWSGWGPSSLNTRYQPTEQAGLTLGQV